MTMDDFTNNIALRRAFSPELRTASVVPRWSIVWTLTRDTVSNHSFYVALYAREIARILEWGGDYGNLMYCALVHDLDETISGDIVAPVKEKIVDKEKAKAYIHDHMMERMPGVIKEIDRISQKGAGEYFEIQSIVKAADRFDALIYLIIEQRLGNGVIAGRIGPAEIRFRESWDRLPALELKLDTLWHDVIQPAIFAHQQYGGNGI
jgi:5'-deoxynucleotidase YfbR-like HD superfamily hydrolase